MSGFDRIPSRSNLSPNTLSADVDQLMDNIDAISKSDLSTPSASVLLDLNSDRVQTFTLTADRIVKIDGTGIKAGERFDLSGLGQFVLHVQANDNTDITFIPNGRLVLESKIDNPVVFTNWRTVHAMGGLTSYLPNYTGFGTVTNNIAKGRREGGYWCFNQYMTSGTTITTIAKSDLPFSMETSSTINSMEIFGNFANNDDPGNGFVLVEPSVIYIEFSNFGTALTFANADGMTNNGNNMSIIGRVPIDGWEMF